VSYTVTKHAAVVSRWLATVPGNQGIGGSLPSSRRTRADTIPRRAGDTAEGGDAITTDQLADIVMEGSRRGALPDRPRTRRVLRKFALRHTTTRYSGMLQGYQAAVKAAA